MNTAPVLTIAVPTYNMEQWLEKNLATYDNERLMGRLEVLCLNNASEDSSKQIIQSFVKKCPRIFRLIDRDSRGYGSSINEAIAQASGRYFRIVDADDWVNSDELVKLVNALETCQADIVLTDYQIVNMQDGSCTPVKASQKQVPYHQLFHDWNTCIKLLPSIHSTTYRTTLLRDSGFYMQDMTFFVDEEYVILPYLYAKTSICYPFDVYRYQVANPAQSTSPKNRAKYLEHRERVLRRMILVYQEAARSGQAPEALEYCFTRIKNGIGDHFTTLYMYVEDRTEGRRMASAWGSYIRQNASEFWPLVRKKEKILTLLNYFHVSLAQYANIKRLVIR